MSVASIREARGFPRQTALSVSRVWGLLNNQGLALALRLAQGQSHLRKPLGFSGRFIVSFWASLRAGCKNSMNHGKEGVPHEARSRCSYSHQYDNRVYTCKVSPPGFPLLQRLACWSCPPFRKAWSTFAASQSVWHSNWISLELLPSSDQRNSLVFVAGASCFFLGGGAVKLIFPSFSWTCIQGFCLLISLFSLRMEVLLRNPVLISSVHDRCIVCSSVLGPRMVYIQFMTIRGAGFFTEMNFLVMGLI